MTATFINCHIRGIDDPPGKYDVLMNGWNEPSKQGNGNVFAVKLCTDGGSEAVTQNKHNQMKCIILMVLRYDIYKKWMPYRILNL